MTDFFEIFQPGFRHQREQQDLDKILVVEGKLGGTGPRPLDLESGAVTIVMPRRAPHPGETPATDETASPDGTRAGAPSA